MKVFWKVPERVLQFQAESDDERRILPLLVPGQGVESRYDGDRLEWYSGEAVCPGPSLTADLMMIKTYDAGGVLTATPLQDALVPELRDRLFRGGAYQLVFWGQGGTPSFKPQRVAPLHDLGVDSTATASGPAP
jgi:hypothetical protein